VPFNFQDNKIAKIMTDATDGMKHCNIQNGVLIGQRCIVPTVHHTCSVNVLVQERCTTLAANHHTLACLIVHILTKSCAFLHLFNILD